MVAASLLAFLTVTCTAMAQVDPRGPIEYPGMKALADADGVQARNYVFHDDCQKPSPWQAQWVWLGGNQSP